jgi:hypothetical protein
VIFAIIIDPIRVMLLMYYRFIEAIKKKSLLELFGRRIYGLIISIIITTPIVNFVFNFVGMKLLLIGGYILLMSLSLLMTTDIVVVPETTVSLREVEEKGFDPVEEQNRREAKLTKIMSFKK